MFAQEAAVFLTTDWLSIDKPLYLGSRNTISSTHDTTAVITRQNQTFRLLHPEWNRCKREFRIDVYLDCVIFKGILKIKCSYYLFIFILSSTCILFIYFSVEHEIFWYRFDK